MDSSKKYELMKLNKQIVRSASQFGTLRDFSQKAAIPFKKFKEAFEKIYPQN